MMNLRNNPQSCRWDQIKCIEKKNPAVLHENGSSADGVGGSVFSSDHRVGG